MKTVWSDLYRLFSSSHVSFLQGPYFQYSAHAPKDDPSPTTSEWPNVPLSIHHAKDWTQHQAIWFGELKEEQLSINHLCLLAWVTSGTKRVWSFFLLSRGADFDVLLGYSGSCSYSRKRKMCRLSCVRL